MSDNPYLAPKAKLLSDISPLLSRKVLAIFNMLGVLIVVAALLEMSSSRSSNPIFVWLSFAPVIVALVFTKFILIKRLWLATFVLNLTVSVLYAVALVAVLLDQASVVWQGLVYLLFMLITFIINCLFCREQKPNYAIKGTSV